MKKNEHISLEDIFAMHISPESMTAEWQAKNEHLHSCGECQEILTDYQKIETTCKSEKEEGPSLPTLYAVRRHAYGVFKKPTWDRWFSFSIRPLAWALSLCLVAGLGYYTWKHQPIPQNGDSKIRAGISIPDQNKMADLSEEECNNAEKTYTGLASDQQPDFLYRWGTCLEKGGHSSEALTKYRELEKMSPSYPGLKESIQRLGSTTP